MNKKTLFLKKSECVFFLTHILKNGTKLQLKHGARLSEQRDAGKRMWNEMPATEQQLIEDYETEWSIKLYEAVLVKKPRIR